MEDKVGADRFVIRDDYQRCSEKEPRGELP